MNNFENMTVQQVAESGITGADSWLLGLQTTAQINAADAQIRSARFQLAAVIAMFLTVVATLTASAIAHYFSN